MNAKEESTTPQTLFEGCDGIFDWNSLSEEDKAKAGWVVYDPPEYNPICENIEISFEEDEDTGIWSAVYTKVPVEITPAIIEHFKNKVAEKRWLTEVTGVKVDELSFVVPTTAESIAKINSVVMCYSAGTLAEEAVIDFNSGTNTAKINKTQLISIYQQLTDYIQACYSRQAELYEEIDEIATDEDTDACDIAELLSTELETGWPDNGIVA